MTDTTKPKRGHNKGADPGGIVDFSVLHGRCRLDDETGCMVWAGGLSKGSGRLWFRGMGVIALPTAFALCKTGAPAPKGRMWVPRCGNKLCCTENHRFLGTRSDMMKVLRPQLDAAHKAKIRASCRKSRRSKYCPELKATILSSGEPAQVLGRRLDLSHDLVSRVRSGAAWADAPASSVFSWRPPA